MVNPEGNRVSEGIDFGEVASDGRLIRITGFFGLPMNCAIHSWSSALIGRIVMSGISNYCPGALKPYFAINAGASSM